jgi:pyruvate ferredoxin oxidoreductase alpha subunit
MFHDTLRPRIVNFLMGLGGRDMKVEDFTAMVERAGKKKDESYEYYGVRES